MNMKNFGCYLFAMLLVGCVVGGCSDDRNVLNAAPWFLNYPGQESQKMNGPGVTSEEVRSRIDQEWSRRRMLYDEPIEVHPLFVKISFPLKDLVSKEEVTDKPDYRVKFKLEILGFGMREKFEDIWLIVCTSETSTVWVAEHSIRNMSPGMGYFWNHGYGTVSFGCADYCVDRDGHNILDSLRDPQTSVYLLLFDGARIAHNIGKCRFDLHHWNRLVNLFRRKGWLVELQNVSSTPADFLYSCQ